MSVSIRVEGAKEISDALKGLPKRVANKVLRQAIRAALKPVLAAAKANVPRDSGELAQSLVIRVAKYKKRGQIVLLVTTDPKKFEGASYAASVEFGDSDQAPQPFLQQTFSQTGEAALDDAMRRIVEGIEHEVRNS